MEKKIKKKSTELLRRQQSALPVLRLVITARPRKTLLFKWTLVYDPTDILTASLTLQLTTNNRPIYNFS